MYISNSGKKLSTKLHCLLLLLYIKNNKKIKSKKGEIQMKFKINRQILLANLSKVSKAVNNKTPFLALTGILFNLTSEYLELIGSDNDLCIRCIINKEVNGDQVIEIEEVGSTVINEKIICEIVRKVESDMIEIDVMDNLAKIRSDKSIFSVNTIPAIDYPSIDFSLIGDSFSIDALELKNVFDQTLFASSDKEARPILTGLNVKCANNTLEFVATDTYRLSKKIIELSTSNEFNVTIPKSSLDELNKIIELGTMVQVYITEKKVIFDLEDCVVISRLISGTYPDTSRLIPNAFDQTLTLSTKDLLGAVDRASILLTERNNVVKLNMKDDEVFVSAKSMEVGYVVEKLNDYYYEGNPLMISFSARFLVEAVRALNSEEITLHFTGDMKPIILKSKTNPNLIELILPVRTYN